LHERLLESAPVSDDHNVMLELLDWSE